MTSISHDLAPGLEYLMKAHPPTRWKLAPVLAKNLLEEIEFVTLSLRRLRPILTGTRQFNATTSNQLSNAQKVRKLRLFLVATSGSWVDPFNEIANRAEAGETVPKETADKLEKAVKRWSRFWNALHLGCLVCS